MKCLENLHFATRCRISLFEFKNIRIFIKPQVIIRMVIFELFGSYFPNSTYSDNVKISFHFK